jgi:hypothetical protein
VLGERRRPDDPGPLDLVVTTRGEGQAPGFVTVDATPTLGGPASRTGEPADWDRFLAGLIDLQASLARWTRRRQVHVLARAHLTACIAVGRVFNQAAGWRLIAAGRHGDAAMPPEADPDAHVKTVVDRVGGPGAMTVEIDLVGANVTQLTTSLLRTAGPAPCARLQISRRSTGDLTPDETSASAAVSAAAVREQVAACRPSLVRVTCAAPADFAVLFANRLTSLHADLQLYERAGDRYAPSLLIPAGLP